MISFHSNGFYAGTLSPRRFPDAVLEHALTAQRAENHQTIVSLWKRMLSGFHSQAEREALYDICSIAWHTPVVLETPCDWVPHPYFGGSRHKVGYLT